MPISVGCPECGRGYNVKDELAGKKFKCKDCGALVAVSVAKKGSSATGTASAKTAKSSPANKPVAKKPSRPKVAGDDDFLDSLNSKGLEDGDSFDDDYGEESDESTPPPVRKKKKVAAGKRPSKGRKSGGVSGGTIAKFSGGAVGILFLLGVILRVIGAVMGGAGGLGGVTWTEFSPPGGRYSVSLPGAAKLKPQTGVGGEATTTYLAETRQFACAVNHGKLPPGSGAVLTAMDPKMMIDTFLKEGWPGAQRVSDRPASLSGLPCQELSFNHVGMRFTERFVIVGDELFNAEFVSRGEPPQAEMAKFFDSFRIIGTAANPLTAATPNMPPIAGMPGSPAGTPAPPANPASGTAAAGNYQQRRAAFQTRLLKSGPSPQNYQNETPPPGVAAVTFLSGNLTLKAWVKAPNVPAGTKSPALIFLHGGFAFGAEDLEACRPAMDAGMVVMAPMLRGENGNPGNYELFLGEVDDARAAAKWLSTQPSVDANRIYAFGHSVGGGVSAMLSLLDDVPILHCGSSGGLYPEIVFVGWQADGSVPFDMSNPEERRMRMLIGNMRDMKRQHHAYLGASDELGRFQGTAKQEAQAGQLMKIETIPGDHMTSFDPALRKYVQLIQTGK